MAISLITKLLGICTCFFALCNADLASEQAANSVELKFYRLTSDTWNSGSLETTLAGLIVAEANTYCESNLAACQMYTCCNAAFKEIDVGKDTSYPKNVNKDMLYKLNLKFPAGSDIRNDSTLDYVISKSTLQAIIGNIRTDVKNDLGYYITYVGSDFYGIPPASLANRIIIPIACVILLILIIVTIALHFWNKKREHKERMQKKVLKKQQKFGKNKDQPKYDVDTEEPKVPATPDRKTDDEKEAKTRHRRKVHGAEEKIYKTKDIKMSPTKQHHGGASDTDSAIKMDDKNDDRMDRYGDSGASKFKSLPPLKADEPADEDRKERKKKKKEKKKKKSSRRREEDNAAYLGGASDDDNALTTEL